MMILLLWLSSFFSGGSLIFIVLANSYLIITINYIVTTSKKLSVTFHLLFFQMGLGESYLDYYKSLGISLPLSLLSSWHHLLWINSGGSISLYAYCCQESSYHTSYWLNSEVSTCLMSWLEQQVNDGST